MDNITELNEFICAEAKPVCDKVSISLRNPKRNTKIGWEFMLEGVIKKLRQQ